MDEETLQQIWSAASAVEGATAKLRQVVAEAARQPGADKTAIAAAARVTRQTVYRWVADTDGSQPYANPVEAMNEALIALLEAGSGPAHDLGRGLQLGGRTAADRMAKARRVMLGVNNMGGSAQSLGMPAEAQAAISAGVIAAQAILRTGKRPS